MALATPSDAGADAAAVVGALAAEVESEVGALSERIAERIRREIPDFHRVPRTTLRGAVEGNLRRALDALRELRAATPAELERSENIGRERAEQGLAIDTVLQGHRVTVSVLWVRFAKLARERGVDVASVLAFSETLWRWADAVMDAVASAHREVELDRAREEQQRRDAFVIALLHGSIDPIRLGHECAAQGLDPERRHVPFRARAREGDLASGAQARRAALALAGEDGLVTGLDGDLVGVSARRPGPLPGVVVGVGAPERLTDLPVAFASASRALQTALAFGQNGVFALAELSIRPAILVDPALGDAFVARYLEPLAEMGRLGAELETTLRAWLDSAMRIEDTARALFVHPNTLRHRLRRFEEATGADLRRPADLIELWWALERRRLESTAPPAAPPPPG